MGTVRGDLHDIGKNLVCMMAEGAGFEVHDIGVDQSVEKFMAAADKCQPTIIGMSALLTTTMTYMKTVIDGFEAAGSGHIKMAVGGAPISQMFADEIGADGYGQNASAAVDLFLKSGQFGPKQPRERPVTTTYKILYWQEVPSQIKAEDERDEVTLALGRAIHGAHRPARRASAGCRPPTTTSRSGSGARSSSAPGAAQDVAEAVQSRARSRSGLVEAQPEHAGGHHQRTSHRRHLRATSLFEAAAHAGVRVPTSCVAQGKCKECIVEVTARHGSARAAKRA